LSTPGGTFGSDPLEAKHVLDDATVSPLHARLDVRRGTFTLADLGSSSGTWVNGERLSAPRILRHGDVIRFGRLSFQFLLRKPPTR
jgi:pSer/pThr/pTyr-binding forkhead associated (FHA) protein